LGTGETAIRILWAGLDAGHRAATGQGLDLCSFEHKHGAELACLPPKLPVVSRPES
jgi:hypothetical protein